MVCGGVGVVIIWNSMRLTICKSFTDEAVLCPKPKGSYISCERKF